MSMLKKHYSGVVIDDFIGGKEGFEMIQKLRKVGRVSEFWDVLSINTIRNVVLKKLGRRKYDLMIFVETGGVFMLGCKEMFGHANRVVSLPLSSHYPQTFYADKLGEYIQDFKEYIEHSKRIAIVEGDVGTQGVSFQRLNNIKNHIRKINNKAIIDVIVGVCVRDLINAKFPGFKKPLITIFGIAVDYLIKLSDIARGYEAVLIKDKKALESLPDIPEVRKELAKSGLKPYLLSETAMELVRLWHRRKTLPVLFEKK